MFIVVVVALVLVCVCVDTVVKMFSGFVFWVFLVLVLFGGGEVVSGFFCLGIFCFFFN